MGRVRGHYGIAAADGALHYADIDDVVVTGLPGQDADVQTTVKYSDYGTKVEAAKPAAADVVEAPDAMYQAPST